MRMSVTEEGLTLLVQRQKFAVAVSALDGRVGDAAHRKAERAGGGVHLFDDARVLRGVADDAALADFAFAHFELRLDEDDDAPALSQERRERGQHLRRGDE